MLYARVIKREGVVRRQLFLPVPSIILAGSPLFLTTLLGRSGAVAGDVEFQDDRMVDHPVDGRRGCHWVGEDVLPLGEDQIRGDAWPNDPGE